MEGVGVALAHLRISFRLVYRTPEVRRRGRKILPNMGGKEERIPLRRQGR